MQGDVIVYKASNYTSIKPADTKARINRNVMRSRFITENIHNLFET